MESLQLLVPTSSPPNIVGTNILRCLAYKLDSAPGADKNLKGLPDPG